MLSPVFVRVIIIFQSVCNFVLYVVYSKGVPTEGTLGEGVVHTGELLLMMSSLLFVFFLLRKMAREE